MGRGDVLSEHVAAALRGVHAPFHLLIIFISLGVLNSPLGEARGERGNFSCCPILNQLGTFWAVYAHRGDGGDGGDGLGRGSVRNECSSGEGGVAPSHLLIICLAALSIDDITFRITIKIFGTV